MPHKKITKKAEKLLESYRKKELRLATAESCTGGLIAALLTGIAGSSDVFDRGFVTYSNESKTELLGVDKNLIARFGAVSKEVAEDMARGALHYSAAHIAVAVTGIAGPSGGTKAKPVGLVYIAVASRHYEDVIVRENLFKGDRAKVRKKSVDTALSMLKNIQAFF